MRLTYDRSTDAAYLYFAHTIEPGEIAHGHVCDIEIQEGAVIMQFDVEDRLLGIEILGASKILRRSVLDAAE